MGNKKVLVWAFGPAGTIKSSAAAQQPTSTTAQTPQATQIDRYVVGQAKPPEVPCAPVKDLTLQRAEDIALEKKLDLKAARLNPAIQDYALQRLRATFRPTFTGTYSYKNSSTPNTRTLDALGGDRTTSQLQNFNTGVSQSLPWHGLSLAGSFTNSRNNSSDLSFTKNPTFSPGLSFSASQPLLHNFAIDNNRNSLRTQQITRQITDINLLQTIENTKASVRAAYWSLRSAIESIEINKRS